MAKRKMIGNLLVEAGIISVKTLERALEMQKGNGKRLGLLLRDLGIVTEEEVLYALGRQCGLKTMIGFSGQDFDKELLDLIPARLAFSKIIFPLKQDRRSLTLVTLDPFDYATFDAITKKTRKKIHLTLSTREEIMAAIEKNYKTAKWNGSALNRKLGILIIDTSLIITNFLQGPIAEEGFEVFAANDGIDGLKLAFSGNPDLIICDMDMPRMDGYSFLNALKAHPEKVDIPVILMVGNPGAKEESRALAAGFAGFISKPTLADRVTTKIKEVLKASNKADPQPDISQ